MMQRIPWEYVIGAFTLVTALWGVILPAFRTRKQWVPTETEWIRVKQDIQSLNRDILDETDYKENTKQALRLVLTSESGYGRVGMVPMALDVIQSQADRVARVYRALSAQSIVVGLAGTVLTFAALFASEQLATRTATAQTAQALASRVLQHLSTIYFINAGAILLGFILYHAAWRAKHGGDQAVHIASEAFGELSETGAGTLGPELAGALERSAREFREFSEILFNNQFSKIERLLGQVQGLGDGIRTLVKEVVTHNKQDQGLLLAQLREQSTTIERITERLDGGFKLLAQPFIQGIPAMQAMTDASEQLKDAAEVLSKADFPSVSTKLSDAAAAIAVSVGEAPARMLEGLETAATRLQPEMAAVVAEGVEPTIGRAVLAISRQLESLETQLNRVALQTRDSGREVCDRVSTTAEALSVLTERANSNAGMLRDCIDALQERIVVQHSAVTLPLRHSASILNDVHVAVAGIQDEIGRVQMARVIEELREAVARLPESLTGVRTSHPFEASESDVSAPTTIDVESGRISTDDPPGEPGHPLGVI